MLLLNVTFIMPCNNKKKHYIPKWFTGFFSEFFKVSTYKIFSWWLVTSEEQKALTTNFSGWLLGSDLC